MGKELPSLRSILSLDKYSLSTFFLVRQSYHLANKSCQEFPRFKSSFLTNTFVKILLICGSIITHEWYVGL